MSNMTVDTGECALGIELGSTRVKAVLVAPDSAVLAGGSAEWASHLVEGHWTYSLDEVWATVQGAFRSLDEDFRTRTGEPLRRVGALGVSAMMHGYLAFDSQGQLLVPFRTWQDTTTAQAAEQLCACFDVNIPMRWSIAHLYQAVLDDEAHVPQIASLNTLAGYVHWRLSGERVLGVGDASGMFPIAAPGDDYDAELLGRFGALVADRDLPWELADLLPEVRLAGEAAGSLTPSGALLLDPSGQFQPGAVMAAPEGDAGTGMVATNSIRPATANVSAGTSIFAMVVLEKPMDSLHEELDPVSTPDGSPVVMVHCNNGAVDLQDWVGLFGQAAALLGAQVDTDTLFRTLYEEALSGSVACDGMMAYNFRAGEPVTGLAEGRPLFARLPETPLDLGTFMRTHLYSSFGALRMGFDVLRAEDVRVDEIFAHGGLFKTQGVAQRFLSAALDVPVTVASTASEGGAWGMALLAAFTLRGGGELPVWLEENVFVAGQRQTIAAESHEVQGFDSFMERYRAGLAIEQTAVDALSR